jgi:N-acetylglucosaminyl-diphospho-decaprenol L-rhamnosyltransferase
VSEVANAINTAPRVVIAIVATDEARNLVGCLGSLKASIYREFSVVICENGGHEAFERDVRELSQVPGMIAAEADANDRLGAAEGQRFRLAADQRVVRVLRSRENRGYSGGVNFCIAAAGADWDFIWVLNPDTFPEPDALRALVRRQAEGGYGIVGSKIVLIANGRVQLWGGLKFWPLLGRARSLGHGQPVEMTPDSKEVEADLDIVAGTAMFVSKDYIKTVGVMDEDFFVYHEDSEWSLRRGKFRLGYAHDSVVHHVAGATSGSGGPRPKRSRFSIYLSERNRVIIAKKRYAATWPLFAGVALLETLELLLRFHSWRSFTIGLSGWWAGVRGETGMPGFMRAAQGPATKVFLQRADS